METEYVKQVKATVRRLTVGRVGINKRAASLAVDFDGDGGHMTSAAFQRSYLRWLAIEDGSEGVRRAKTESPSRARVAAESAKMRRHANLLGFRGPKSVAAVKKAMRNFVTAWEDTYVNEVE